MCDCECEVDEQQRDAPLLHVYVCRCKQSVVAVAPEAVGDATADSTSIHESAPKPSTLTSSAPYPRLRLPSTTFHAMVAEDTSMATRRYQRRSGGLCDDFSAVALVHHRAMPTWGEAALNSDI